jgi:hypothetical protein
MKLSRFLQNCREYCWSSLPGTMMKADFNAAKTFCFFVGYPRSGHSLIGSLLDAHPRLVIAHELAFTRYLKWGFSRRQILKLIARNTEVESGQGRTSTGYDYGVPGQWQGRWEQMECIGDKSGG